MNEREELAGMLFTTDNSKAVSPWSEWEHCKQEPRLSEYVYAMADALIQAGYRKPRTITTEEEVEALTQGTRLYSTKTRDFWILNDLSQHGGLMVHGTGGGYTFLHDFIRQQAPLIVLHEPDQQP